MVCSTMFCLTELKLFAKFVYVLGLRNVSKIKCYYSCHLLKLLKI